MLVVIMTPVMYSDISGESGTLILGFFIGITIVEIVMITVIVMIATVVIMEIANDFYYMKKVLSYCETTLENTHSSMWDNMYSTKKSKKARSTDKPSYVNRGMIDKSLTVQQNARNMMNNKWGPGNWNKGPGNDFNKIVKWITRGEFLRVTVNFFNDENNTRNVFDYQIYRRNNG